MKIHFFAGLNLEDAAEVLTFPTPPPNATGPAAASEAFLREACGQDAAMFGRLKGLLESQDRAGNLLHPRCGLLPPFLLVPTEGVEPTHSHEYQILSLARLPIPPRRLPYYPSVTRVSNCRVL